MTDGFTVGRQAIVGPVTPTVGLDNTVNRMQLFAYIALFLGAIGQAGFYGSMIRPHVPLLIALCLASGPGFIVFFLTFFNQPLIPPKPFRRCLLVVMCWVAIATLLAETLAYFGSMKPDSEKNAVTLCRVLMHLIWFSYIPLVSLYGLAKRAEKDYAALAQKGA